MCGIAGVIDFNGDISSYAGKIYNMRDCLKHRGPDQDGIYISENCGLAHSRLAVIDIENGRQPMSFTAGENKYILIYNGELYNTNEIRSILLKKGHSFLGYSDTEVVLKAYVEWKDKCVELFNGIFAFALWEAHNRRLFIARDRMGVKPFFYSVQSGEKQFVFGSEIKALFASGKVVPTIDADGIAEVMLIGPGRTPGCGVFRNISELLPAHCGYYSENGLELRQYWKLMSAEHRASFEDTRDHVAFLVRDAIEKQLVSDVPVCTFLSGGLDSSIISSVASRHMKERGTRLQTFSVDYSENSRYFTNSRFQPTSDDHYIKIMADYIDSDHTSIVIDNTSLAEALYDAVDARDLPGMSDIDSSLLLFCREIKKAGTVALSGECADEIFGGYPWYRDVGIGDSEGFPWAKSSVFRESFLREEISRRIDTEEYVNSKWRTTWSSADISGSPSDMADMQRMVKLNADWFMQTLLDRKDRMSMSCGLEVRVPFCDYRIAEYMYSVPTAFRDYRGYEKGLLREAMREYLPEEVLYRKKSPYPKTHNPEYLKIVSEMLNEVIDNPSSPILDIVKKESLVSLLSMTSDEPWYGQLMTTPQTIAYMLQLNYWLQKYHVRLII